MEVRWRCGTRLGRLSRKEIDERRPKMAGVVRVRAQLELLLNERDEDGSRQLGIG